MFIERLQIQHYVHRQINSLRYDNFFAQRTLVSVRIIGKLELTAGFITQVLRLPFLYSIYFPIGLERAVKKSIRNKFYSELVKIAHQHHTSNISKHNEQHVSSFVAFIVPHLRTILVVVFVPIFHGMFKQNSSNIVTNSMTAGLNRLPSAEKGPKVNLSPRLLAKFKSFLLSFLRH